MRQCLIYISSPNMFLQVDAEEQTWPFMWNIDGLVLSLNVTPMWILSSFLCCLENWYIQNKANV